jgi:hypothetical protein
VFRIATGVLLVAYYLMIGPSWERFFAPDGMLALTDESVRGLPQDSWSLFYWTGDFLPVRVWWWAGLLAALAFTAGWRTRIATAALFVLHVSMIHTNVWITNGEDLVWRMLLFYSCFASLAEVASIDAWLRSRRAPADEPVRQPSIWPIRLMQVNVALIYLFSQPYKLIEDPAWLSGDALYYTMVNATWSRFPWPELFYWRPLAAVATWGSLLGELAFPIVVWIPRVRLYAVLLLAALHTTISVVLQNVTLFSLAMPAALLIFLSSEDLRRLGALLGLSADRQRRA